MFLQEGSLYKIIVTEPNHEFLNNDEFTDFFYYMGIIKENKFKIFISEYEDEKFETYETYLDFKNSDMKITGNTAKVIDQLSGLLHILIKEEPRQESTPELEF